MALVATLNITADGRVSTKLKNGRAGHTNQYTYIAVGTFGSGTVTVQVSPDGTNWVSNIDNGSTLTFTEADSNRIIAGSDEDQPVFLGFSMANSTNPNVTIYVYNNR